MFLPAGLLVLGLALGVLTLATVRASPQFSLASAVPGGQALLLLAAWSCVVAAVSSWAAGSRRAGLVLGLAGIAWLVPEWESPDAPTGMYAAALLLGAVTPALVLHAVTAGSERRGRRTVERALVVLGYVIGLGLLGLGPALVLDPASLECGADCPTNPFLVAGRPEVVEALAVAGHALTALWVAAAVVLLAAFPAARRVEQLLVRAPAAAFLVVAAGRHVELLLRDAPQRSATARGWWLAATLALTATAAGAAGRLLAERRARRELADVVLALSHGREPGRLRGVLAERLGDPSVELRYRLEDGTVVDEDGRVAPLPVSEERRVTLLQHDGTRLGLLVHSVAIAEPRLRDLVATVHLALEQQALTAQALAVERALRESGLRLLAARDAERRRLERDLHDGAQQRLLGISLGLQLLAREHRTPEVEDARGHVAAAVGELRALAQALSPPVLVDAGLGAALRALGETRAVRVGAAPDERFDPAVETTVYQLVERVSRHAPAHVRVEHDGASLRAIVSVDGDAPDMTEAADRVLTLGGSLEVQRGSSATVVATELPAEPVPTRHSPCDTPRKPLRK